eukprot:2570834-Amphidinium_carterae.1
MLKLLENSRRVCDSFSRLQSASHQANVDIDACQTPWYCALESKAFCCSTASNSPRPLKLEVAVQTVVEVKQHKQGLQLAPLLGVFVRNRCGMEVSSNQTEPVEGLESRPARSLLQVRICAVCEPPCASLRHSALASKFGTTRYPSAPRWCRTFGVPGEALTVKRHVRNHRDASFDDMLPSLERNHRVQACVKKMP